MLRAWCGDAAGLTSRTFGHRLNHAPSRDKPDRRFMATFD